MHDTAVYNRLPDGISGRLCGCDRRGGGLISLPAYLIAGVPTHMALGTNKMSSMMGTAIATGRFAKNGYIQFKKVVWFIVAALIGFFDRFEPDSVSQR